MGNSQINIHENEFLYLKIFFVISSIFIVLSMILIVITPPATGYELSIYNAYPWYFWFFVSIIVLIGVISLIFYSVKKMKGNSWIYAFFSIMFIYFIFLLLPIFRGYTFLGRGGADVLTHIGNMKTILQTGHLFKENFYPITHIVHVNLNFFGIPLEKAVTFVPAFFALLYLIFTLNLARRISENHYQSIFILAFTSPLLFSFFHTCIHPFMIGLYMYPIIIYSFIRRKESNKKLNFSIISIIFLMTIVFIHPLMTLILMIVFITFIIFEYIYFYFLKRKSFHIIIENMNFIIILLSSFIIWYIPFSSIQNLFRKIFAQLDKSISADYVNTIGSAQLPIIQIIQVLLSKYGIILFYISIGSLFAITLLLKTLKSSSIIKFKYEFIFSGQLILGAFIGVVIVLSYLIVADPIRAFIYAIFISSVFLGLIIYKHTQIFSREKFKLSFKSLVTFFVIVVIVLSSVLCIFNVYPSPITSMPNQQMSLMEINGLQFMLTMKIPYLPIASKGYSFKIENYLFGIHNAFEKQYEGSFSLELPSHFGYNNGSIFNQMNFNKSYILISEYNKIAYQSLPVMTWPKAHRFTYDDYAKVNSDSVMDRIFDNDEFEAWIFQS